MTRCETCGDWTSPPGFHRCPPQWIVTQEDDEYEWEVRVYARYPSDAAEMWAEQDDRNSAEYSIVSGCPARVRVRRADGSDATVYEYVVSGESVPEYHAELQPSEAAQP